MLKKAAYRTFAPVTLVGVSLVMSCGDPAPDPVTASAGPGTATGDAGSSESGGSCDAGTTDSCTCPASMAQGTRSCFNGTWTACACTSASSSTATDTNSGDCLGGRYEGSFEGSYRSDFALGAGIPVVALNLTGEPGLAFTLEQQIDSSRELPVYTVRDGYVKGTADGVFPFEGVLTGTLDCATKKFTGQLDGGYSIVVSAGVNEAKFIGPVEGVYDPTTHSFSLGMWTLEEKDPALDVLGDAGGEGTWEASYAGPGTDSGSSSADAGSAGSSADAGP